jgi:hypothetical protein
LADKYKLHGSKRPGEKVDRVLLEGTSSNPVKWIDVGGDAVELNEEQVAELRSRGVDVRKSGSTSDEPEQSDTGAGETGAADAPATETPGSNPGDKK